MEPFARANDACAVERWRTGAPDGPDWHPLRALLDGPELHDQLIADIERRCAPTGSQLPRRYLATYLGRALAAVPTARHLMDGPVTRLDVDALRIRTDPIGWIPEVALDGPTDASHGDLRAELLPLLEPVVEALARHGGTGRRALWCHMVDGVGLGCAAAGRPDAAHALLAAAPLRAHRIELVAGQWALNGCCRSDLLPDGELCERCPKRSAARRGLAIARATS